MRLGYQRAILFVVLFGAVNLSPDGDLSWLGHLALAALTIVGDFAICKAWEREHEEARPRS
ncbi:MAG: hypothetical protein V3W41_21950 [Planctomycetota bacterium]